MSRAPRDTESDGVSSRKMSPLRTAALGSALLVGGMVLWPRAEARVPPPDGAPEKSVEPPSEPPEPTSEPAEPPSEPVEPPPDANESHLLDLPPRPEGAQGGAEILDDLSDADLGSIESRVVEEVEAGNIPGFLRTLVRVDVRGPDGATDTVWVTPDYLSVGSDDDHFRVPLRAAAAERLAEKVGALLPTPQVVDAVHRAADIRLPPRSNVGTPAIHWVGQVRIHDRHVDDQLRAWEAELGQLVAGHMKDVVITPALTQNPEKLAIYGMHHPFGSPTQPLSTFHDDVYVDYAQGIRLVASEMVHRGEPMDATEVLAPEEYHHVLSPAVTIQLPAYR